MTTPETTHSNRKNAVIVITILIFGCFVPTYIQSTNWYATLVSDWIYEVRVLAKPMSRLILVVLSTWFLLGIHPKQQPRAFGLQPGWRNFAFAIALGVLFSLPMLIVGLLGGINEDLVLRSLHFKSLGPGFFEEFFFRAFAFGLLVKLAKWRVWPAAIFTGIIFGLAHVHLSLVQEMNITNQLGWIAVLAAAGAFYAWIYASWDFNLWIPITMHTLLDLCWALFNMDQSPLGSFGLFASTTLVFMIPSIVTIRRMKKTKMKSI